MGQDALLDSKSIWSVKDNWIPQPASLDEFKCEIWGKTNYTQCVCCTKYTKRSLFNLQTVKTRKKNNLLYKIPPLCNYIFKTTSLWRTQSTAD